MSYSQYSRGGYDHEDRYEDNRLPKVNNKRFEDVIDYSQQRPQTGYSDNNYENQNQGGGIRGMRSTGYSDNSAAVNQTNFDAQDGQPLQLIKVDARSGKFMLNEEAAEELSKYEGNISFVTVAGKYRTGKSFLLNKLLNLRGEGFTVDPTTDACTQGIWIWSKPVYNERDNLHIFFMDTEGAQSVEKSSTHDAKIFALSLLISSYFIYNSVGAIDENSINDLSLTTQLSRNIAISTDENSEHTLSYYTPKFLWALRDFTLELQDARGKAISSNQYLENALTDQSTHSKTNESNRKIRQALLNYFKDRECLTFVRPANDENELRRLATLNNNQIRPEFLKQVHSLRDKVISKATAKQLKGVNLNMRMYFAMVNKYVEAINQGSVPNISTAWDHLVENECREAYEQSTNLYDMALRQFFFNEEKSKSIEELYNILKNIRDSTLEKYNKITAAIERNDVAQDYKNELKEYIDQKEQEIATVNEEQNQANNEDLLRELAQLIKDNITTGAYGPKNIHDFHDDFDKLLSDYDAQGQGFTKSTSLINFLKTFQPEAISSLMLALNKSYQTNQKNLEHDKGRFEENEKNLKMNLDVLKEKERSAADELERVRKEKAELAQKVSKLKDQMERIKDEEERKADTEKGKSKTEQAKLREKQIELEELQQRFDRLMAEKAKKKQACCNIF